MADKKEETKKKKTNTKPKTTNKKKNTTKKKETSTKKKVTTKKKVDNKVVATKKEEPKKVENKKAEPKKEEPKKVEVKREEPKKEEVKKTEPKKEEVKKEDKPKAAVKKDANKVEGDRNFSILVTALSVLILIIALWSFIKAMNEDKKHGHKKAAIAFCQMYTEYDANKLSKFYVNDKLLEKTKPEVENFKEIQDRVKKVGADVKTECNNKEGRKLSDEEIAAVLKRVEAKDLGEVKDTYEYEFDLNIFMKEKAANKFPDDATLKFEYKAVVSSVGGKWKVLDIEKK